MMIIGTQGYGGEQSHPDSITANEYIEYCTGLDEQTVDGPCLKGLVDAVPVGIDASVILRSSIEDGTGTMRHRGGETPGNHGLAIRLCGRTACDYHCQVTVSKTHIALEYSNRAYWTQRSRQTCAETGQVTEDQKP